MSFPKKNQDVVIGANLNGLLMAAELKKMGRKVLVLEARELTSPSQSTQTAPSRLSLWPANQIEESLLSEISQYMSLPNEKIAATPMTFSEGELKAFVGFGDKKFVTQNYLSFFNTQDFQLVQFDIEKFQVELMTKNELDCRAFAEVTNIARSEENENSNWMITVNAAHTIEAERVFLASSPFDWSELIPGLNQKLVQKLARSEQVGELSLSLTHESDPFEHSGLHVLYGNKGDFEPILGHKMEHVLTPEPQSEELESHEDFASENKEPPTLSSTWSTHWVTPVHVDWLEDHELQTSLVKYMKRQIKRAYPALFEKMGFERIQLKAQAYASANVELKKAQIPGSDGLFGISPLLESSPCWIQGLKPVLKALNEIQEREASIDTKEQLENEELNPQVEMRPEIAPATDTLRTEAP